MPPPASPTSCAKRRARPGGAAVLALLCVTCKVDCDFPDQYPPPYTLQVRVRDSGCSGTLFSSDGAIECRALCDETCTCSHEYDNPRGIILELRAVPEDGCCLGGTRVKIAGAENIGCFANGFICMVSTSDCGALDCDVDVTVAFVPSSVPCGLDAAPPVADAAQPDAGLAPDSATDGATDGAADGSP